MARSTCGAFVASLRDLETTVAQQIQNFQEDPSNYYYSGTSPTQQDARLHDFKAMLRELSDKLKHCHPVQLCFLSSDEWLSNYKDRVEAMAQRHQQQLPQNVNNPANALVGEWSVRLNHSLDHFIKHLKQYAAKHAYWEFLYLKGDRVLLDMHQRDLLLKLQCTEEEFFEHLKWNDHGVRQTLVDIIKRHIRMQSLLEAEHQRMLREWVAGWHSRASQGRELWRVHAPDQGARLWEAFFQHCVKVTWPDFLEAFEYYFLLDHTPCLPHDMTHQLRLLVDPQDTHQVHRTFFCRALDSIGNGSCKDLIEHLYQRTLDHITDGVYRPKPLPDDPAQLLLHEGLKLELKARHREQRDKTPVGGKPSRATVGTQHDRPPPFEGYGDAFGDPRWQREVAGASTSSGDQLSASGVFDLPVIVPPFQPPPDGPPPEYQKYEGTNSDLASSQGRTHTTDETDAVAAAPGDINGVKGGPEPPTSLEDSQETAQSSSMDAADSEHVPVLGEGVGEGGGGGGDGGGGEEEMRPSSMVISPQDQSPSSVPQPQPRSGGSRQGRHKRDFDRVVGSPSSRTNDKRGGSSSHRRTSDKSSAASSMASSSDLSNRRGLAPPGSRATADHQSAESANGCPPEGGQGTKSSSAAPPPVAEESGSQPDEEAEQPDAPASNAEPAAAAAAAAGGGGDEGGRKGSADGEEKVKRRMPESWIVSLLNPSAMPRLLYPSLLPGLVKKLFKDRHMGVATNVVNLAHGVCNLDAETPPNDEPLKRDFSTEQLRWRALRVIQSERSLTTKALLLRVHSGDLKEHPVVQACGGILITPEGTRFPYITKFGRSSSRKILLPDWPMSEQIASRSHFNIVYKPGANRYFLMDAGSKWGTFVKIEGSVPLYPGAWIRVGGVEFIVRSCGYAPKNRSARRGGGHGPPPPGPPGGKPGKKKSEETDSTQRGKTSSARIKLWPAAPAAQREEEALADDADDMAAPGALLLRVLRGNPSDQDTQAAAAVDDLTADGEPTENQPSSSSAAPAPPEQDATTGVKPSSEAAEAAPTKDEEGQEGEKEGEELPLLAGLPAAPAAAAAAAAAAGDDRLDGSDSPGSFSFWPGGMRILEDLDNHTRAQEQDGGEQVLTASEAVVADRQLDWNRPVQVTHVRRGLGFIARKRRAGAQIVEGGNLWGPPPYGAGNGGGAAAPQPHAPAPGPPLTLPVHQIPVVPRSRPTQPQTSGVAASSSAADGPTSASEGSGPSAEAAGQRDGGRQGERRASGVEQILEVPSVPPPSSSSSGAHDVGSTDEPHPPAAMDGWSAHQALQKAALVPPPDALIPEAPPAAAAQPQRQPSGGDSPVPPSVAGTASSIGSSPSAVMGREGRGRGHRGVEGPLESIAEQEVVRIGPRQQQQQGGGGAGGGPVRTPPQESAPSRPPPGMGGGPLPRPPPPLIHFQNFPSRSVTVDEGEQLPLNMPWDGRAPSADEAAAEMFAHAAPIAVPPPVMMRTVPGAPPRVTLEEMLHTINANDVGIPNLPLPPPPPPPPSRPAPAPQPGRSIDDEADIPLTDGPQPAAAAAGQSSSDGPAEDQESRGKGLPPDPRGDQAIARRGLADLRPPRLRLRSPPESESEQPSDQPQQQQQQQEQQAVADEGDAAPDAAPAADGDEQDNDSIIHRGPAAQRQQQQQQQHHHGYPPALGDMEDGRMESPLPLPVSSVPGSQDGQPDASAAAPGPSSSSGWPPGGPPAAPVEDEALEQVRQDMLRILQEGPRPPFRVNPPRGASVFAMGGRHGRHSGGGGDGGDPGGPGRGGRGGRGDRYFPDDPSPRQPPGGGGGGGPSFPHPDVLVDVPGGRSPPSSPDERQAGPGHNAAWLESMRRVVRPVPSIELEFISGPRMGEKITMNSRSFTLGRAEWNSVQVNDLTLASVSRVHCRFEYRGNRWFLIDNDSTNGTWRRLSCVLEPSAPIPLFEGLLMQAGTHELEVLEIHYKAALAPDQEAKLQRQIGTRF
ncbi:unnamed protein product [Vitrella brassicaformis CCMP3155]|uniref:FHA domain-containing protein n=3 Tax=Vitrella brassicaformis TaxID=1169539 RepID=A0A0G4EHD6_VITBC|nr:unnamed protein product [Vitrella brassicaformis CCMP3155]|eukprot:CEL95440.1 unnamed protein product [Vitrella brassicaformis CCMP3155]